MDPLEKLPAIPSGHITHMLIDEVTDTLYFQQGNYHDSLQVEFQAFDLKSFVFKESIVMEGYSVLHHKTTLLLEDYLIIGMDNHVTFFHRGKSVCICEFECQGQVVSIMTSFDQNEVIVFTDECKIYRIFKN